MILVPSTRVENGVVQNGISSVEQCLTDCMSLGISQCQSIDYEFDSLTDQCIFHTPSSTCNDKMESANILSTHYRLTNCTLTPITSTRMTIFPTSGNPTTQTVTASTTPSPTSISTTVITTVPTTRPGK